ncbi:MAG: hypothetical protein OEV31_00350, partial [Gammaproteobacteria bacterium]|nr:hypothetical protein [Gammaproteobacteria bacterium]
TIGSVSAVSDWWRSRSTPRAVRNGWLYSFTPEHVLRQTVRILDGVSSVCASLDLVRKAGNPD